MLAWASFTVTFAGLRALTHWIRAGHGPSGGGMSGRQAFSPLQHRHRDAGDGGGVGLRGTEKQRRHPATAVAFGAANA